MTRLRLQLESATQLLPFRMRKAMVDSIDQRLGRPVIDRQGIVPPFSGRTRFQVAVNVRPRKP